MVVDLSNVSLSDLAAATGNLDFGGYKGVNVEDPGANQDAATKKYHDDNKYTDAEAVAAADASDKFIERNVVNDVTTTTTLKCGSGLLFLLFKIERAFWMFAGTAMGLRVKSTNTTFQGMMVLQTFPEIVIEGTDTTKTAAYIKFVKGAGQLSSSIPFGVLNTAGGNVIPLEIYSDKIDVKNLPIKDIKNHADATLSGTPKIIELLIGTTSYYFKVYPTKT